MSPGSLPLSVSYPSEEIIKSHSSGSVFNWVHLREGKKTLFVLLTTLHNAGLLVYLFLIISILLMTEDDIFWAWVHRRLTGSLYRRAHCVWTSSHRFPLHGGTEKIISFIRGEISNAGFRIMLPTLSRLEETQKHSQWWDTLKWKT